MALVRSLLTAVVRADGDALVMHVGERPYVVATSGPIELSAHALNLEAMSGMLSQLLPPESLASLDEFGAVEHELAPESAIDGNRFVVVAARGGDDIWIEIRRQRPQPLDVALGLNFVNAEPATTDVMSAAAIFAPAAGNIESTENIESTAATESTARVLEATVTTVAAVETPREATPLALVTPAATSADVAPVERRTDSLHDVQTPSAGVETLSPTETSAFAQAPSRGDTPGSDTNARETSTRIEPPSRVDAPSRGEPPSYGGPGLQSRPGADTDPASVVVPLTRPVRVEPPLRGLSSRPGGIERLLRLASARHASALYLPSDARPHLRIDGDIRVLDGEPVSSSMDVEAALLELMPEAARDALRRGEPTEWVTDLPEIGRVRGTTFRDYRGPGALFQMISARAASAEQLGLSREIQALATETDGLVVVAGPRASGKSTLMAAFVDAINRRRSDHVITLERQIRLVHENRTSLISQREVRGSGDEVVSAAQAALRENPDVLVIEDLRSADVLQLALDAAGSGLLVFASMTAASAPAAVERLLDLAAGDRRAAVQTSLAECLRGVVAQVLLRKSSGGRLAARELLLNTEAVASLIADGQVGQLPLAIDGGRKRGMVPLNDALVAFVQSGAVDVREAYRKAPDRQTLLALLKREGIDTSFVERLA